MRHFFVLVFAALLTSEGIAQTVQDGDSVIRGDGVRVACTALMPLRKTNHMAEKLEKSSSSTCRSLPR